MRQLHYILILSLTSVSLFAQHSRQSVLRDGTIYKLAITETGVYRISQAFLVELGVDVGSIDPRNISIYGNGGGMLPHAVNAIRVDDLVENAIQVTGEDDGRFDENDHILFYAQGADAHYYDSDKNMLRVQKNVYDAQNYYFLKIKNSPGKRLQEQASLNNTVYNTSSFDALLHLEDEKVNLLDAFISTQGSGVDWYGDQFKNISTHTYNFNFPNIIAGDSVKIYAELAARHPQVSSFSIETVAGSFRSSFINSTSFSRPAEVEYAKIGKLNANFAAISDDITLDVNYTGQDAWLDFITINARRALRLGNNQLHFQDVRAWQESSTNYQLENWNNNTQVWDITNPLQAKIQQVNNGSFGASNAAREFVAFNESQALTPNSASLIEAQNIHALDDLDMIILFHERFTAEAARLLEHRRSVSGLRADTVRIDRVFNEFSSGRQDPTAIRDFMHMLYMRSQDFKYLLLFGDGSFDYRDIKGISADQNFIPVYETSASLHPIEAYPSDDFYGLLDEEEGDGLAGDLDIALGRLPVKTQDEARQVVDKIIAYETAPARFGDWRNRLAFIADDQDNNLHLRQTDSIAARSIRRQQNFNQDKIYFDAFPQQSTSGGEGFPLATEALNQTMFKGALAINYLGHGGSKGWAQERVLDRDRGDIRSWSNFNRLPVFITATCSFTGYDDPNQVTAGEEVLLNPNGGGIALFTTVRAVYSSSNEALVKSVFDTMFHLVNGERPTIGEIMRIAKNNARAGFSNTRKFTLIGDPALKLALPKYTIATTKINEQAVDGERLDTLRAFQRVVIEGEVQDNEGRLLSDFNGEITPTIFDKVVTYSTLGQDSDSQAANFQVRNNVLFKGRASVQAGKFRFTFVVPKDINFKFGQGRISYYAKDTSQMTDATGMYERIVIGGTDASVLADDTGPEVEVFMNTEDFVFGSITNENPTLLVTLTDDNGINVAGNSIGHDLEAILDEDTQNTYLLNEFYESDLDDYTKGVVRFPLSDLEPGLHSIRVRAWDIANNSSEGYTEFVVAESAEIALENVLNYPNPFFDNTCFQFEHNIAGQELDIQIHIFSVSGRLVKTIEKRIFAQGFILGRDDCVCWDGTNDFGQPLAKGIYFYQVQLKTDIDVTKTTKSNFQKLVLLK